MLFFRNLYQALVAIEPGSIRGLIGLGDILRSIVLSLAGFSVTAALVILPWVSTALVPLIPNPLFDAAAIWGIGFILDILRRLHGGTMILVPAAPLDPAVPAPVQHAVVVAAP